MLLNSFFLNDLVLSSSIVMAPMTRCAALENQVPSEQMVTYYRDRASVGLVITEATCISSCANAYPHTPGIYNKAQVDGWKRVTDAVHAQGGKIFVQLWHAGMMSHSFFRNGRLPLSPSGVPPLRKKVPRSDLVYEKPDVMEKKDFLKVIELFASAAQYAKEAGFDGVELHGCAGYLLDSFLHYHTNRRSDLYGKEKHRFVVEVFDAVSKFVRTGIRVSPAPLRGMQNMLFDSRDLDVFSTLFRELEKRNVTYIHVATDEDFHPNLGRVTQFVRENYAGILIGGGGYTVEKAKKAIAKGDFDLISFGRLLLANPNLIALIQAKQDLQPFHFEMVSNPPSICPKQNFI